MSGGRKLRIGFSWFGLLIVVLQASPNVIWLFYPPTPDRLAGNASSVPLIEYGEHALGVLIVLMLLFLINKSTPNRVHRTSPAVVAYTAIGLYWFCWGLYFAGFQPNPVIYAMVILPPVAFFCAGIAAKVWPIWLTSMLFAGFHALVALENFPIV